MINVTIKIINTNDNQQYSFINFSVSMQTMICLQLMDVLLVLSKCSLVTQKIIIPFVHYMQKYPPKFGWMPQPYCWTSKFESSHFSSVNETIQ